MLATVERDTALELLELEHSSVRSLIDELNDEEMTRPDTIRYGLYPGQHCSFKDLLAHLITYEAYALEALDEWQAGRAHWIGEAIYSRGHEIHFGGIEQRAPCSLAEVLDEWETTQRSLKDSIRNLSDAAWHALAPYPSDGPTDLGGMLEAIIVAPPRPLYRHLPVHIPDAEAYIDSLRP